jgi:RNA polymerase sigma-70 factor (ECF subfamily)
MKYSDEQLVERFLGGEEKALGALVEKYLKPLYNFAYQLTRDQGAAEDVVQETFVKVWKNLPAFDSGKKFSTWAYAIAKNTAYDFLKKKKSVSFAAFEKEDGENMLENICDENVLYSEALWQKIDNEKDAQAFLDTLAPQIKTILLLHHQQGFALTEIAEIMGHSPNTVKSKYRRAILSLRKSISAKNALSKA